jgi:glycosyltransferase involved in cell wall biosynthesis
MHELRVLHYTSRSSDNCGVGKYQENYIDQLALNYPGEVSSSYFYSPYETRGMGSKELDRAAEELRRRLKGVHVFHVQHEFGLFLHDELARFVAVAKRAKVKVVITVHLSPGAAFKAEPRPGLNLHRLKWFIKERLRRARFTKRHIAPFQQADLILSHNRGTSASLRAHGVAAERIVELEHPVPTGAPVAPSTEIARRLKPAGDEIVLATLGFMHQHKGISEAIHALTFLPDRYRLAIIGGIHPTSNDPGIYNSIMVLVVSLGLQDRVYVTGFVKDDDRMTALIQETDICLFPYNNAYYATVSSGVLNQAFANRKPVIAYPVDNFIDASAEYGQVVFTSAPAFYELVREIERIDVDSQVTKIDAYVEKHSLERQAEKLLAAYRHVAAR